MPTTYPPGGQYCHSPQLPQRVLTNGFRTEANIYLKKKIFFTPGEHIPLLVWMDGMDVVHRHTWTHSWWNVGLNLAIYIFLFSLQHTPHTSSSQHSSSSGQQGSDGLDGSQLNTLWTKLNIMKIHFSMSIVQWQFFLKDNWGKYC